MYIFLPFYLFVFKSHSLFQFSTHPIIFISLGSILKYTVLTILHIQIQATRYFHRQNEEKMVYFYLQYNKTYTHYAQLIGLNTISLHIRNVRNFFCLFQNFSLNNFRNIWYTKDRYLQKCPKLLLLE